MASALSVGVMTLSCNKDDFIEQTESDRLPQVKLDNETGVYTVAVGRELKITPVYSNCAKADYLWTVDGKPVSNTPDFSYVWTETGEYYVTLDVSTAAGSVKEELKVKVVEPAVPVISLPIDGDMLTVLKGTDYVFVPEISNSEVDGFKVEWVIDGKVVGNQLQYTFHSDITGDFKIEILAENIEGKANRNFTVKVVDELPVKISFPTPSYFSTSTDRYTFAGRPVFLTPDISGAEVIGFKWTVNGKTVDCQSPTFVFTPDAPGQYSVSVIVNGQYMASVKVTCVNATEAQRFRQASPTSSSVSTKVFEWCPAPGQFIGETQTGGMTGNETTLSAANAWAEKRLAANSFVSLGGFGGYIIVGFDHSIPCRDGQYDFSVLGNAYFNSQSGTGGSNEPGIVYVMQDVNGNGLPDDEWYELRGSDTGIDGTLQNYSVTYFRPSGSGMAVQWVDNLGLHGVIDYLASFHRQPSYYPAWITADSYTLRGTRLKSQTVQNLETGMWDNWAFGWGYTDNMGSDIISGSGSVDGSGQRNGLKIENAMFPDLSPVKLQYIDFIKVQTGVNSKAGRLGEVSTEVVGFQDLSMTK